MLSFGAVFCGIPQYDSEMQPELKKYQPREELVNIATHAFGLACAIIACTVLMKDALRSGDSMRIAGFGLFGFSLIALYLSSTLYHSSRSPARRKLFRLIDHISIFLLIAGTYSPFLLVNLRNEAGWWLFGMIWTFAILGILFKVRFGTRYPGISLALYLGMGWISIIGFREFYRALDVQSLLLLGAGGLCYTLGVVFYRWERLAYHHAVWHLFVLAGSGLHFMAVIHAASTTGVF